jgi:hypothetical protein
MIEEMIRLSISGVMRSKDWLRILDFSGECIWIPDNDIKAAERTAKLWIESTRQVSEGKCGKMNKQRMRVKQLP